LKRPILGASSTSAWLSALRAKPQSRKAAKPQAPRTRDSAICFSLIFAF
jgi:hypothetical protein